MAIPHTRTRLKGYVTLRAQRGGAELADVAVDAIPTIDDLVVIGAAQQLIINQDRETNNYRREFNPELSGKPSETYPGLPVYKVTLRRVDLYDANLLEAFGIEGTNIVDQFKPITIVAEQPVPTKDDGVTPLDVAGSQFKQRSYIIPGCWLNSFPTEYDIDADDQKYVVEVDMIVRDVISK
jgi:hypothetical protein